MAEKECIRGTASRREKKKRKKIELEMEVLSETADKMAPVVGYFPSGYDPVAAGADPDIKLFRNKKKPNRLELVVRPDDCNVEFVGKSYAGEAALPQLCTYALGVVDKETQTLKIFPIAANKILRLEPRFINGFGEPTKVGEEVIIDEKKKHPMADLNLLYGTKRSKIIESRRQSINKKLNDPSILGPLEVGTDGNLNDEASKDIKEPLDRNIPPYDPSAVTPQSAYPLNNIIPKGERGYLKDILETLELEPDNARNAEFWESNYYPSFVIHRLSKLREIQDEEEKTQFACILSYITHLINFRKVAESVRRRKDKPDYAEAMSKFMIPSVVFQRFLTLFLDPVSNLISSEKSVLLICYVLVLTLHADDFLTDSTDIEKDLAIARDSLKPYFLQLGCKTDNPKPFQKSRMTLPVPLVFQGLKKRRFRRRGIFA
ncbi:DNA-directed RNA polymerase I subunit rpa49 isoform X2 [Dendrobium catenatum]|uniref:DNA-directed RNA polymerase I subunit rpa49 isoform X2 n=1 Tax=Dendrobium catenatum TaxID=906689 RepID=UPI0009F67516|nr:DNA-directed RNA polymerase I subunit rpa49 isoform X2 [Dendrobium catenatum]